MKAFKFPVNVLLEDRKITLIGRNWAKKGLNCDQDHLVPFGTPSRWFRKFGTGAPWQYL